MSLWISAAGISCIGVVYGYVLFYALKRYLPLISQTPPTFKELFPSLASLIIGGSIGAMVTSLDGVNYIGPYGLGLLIGAATNVAITFSIELSYYRIDLAHYRQMLENSKLFSLASKQQNNNLQPPSKNNL